MHSCQSIPALVPSLRWMLIAAMILGTPFESVHAEPPRSRTPVFGNEGWEFNKKAKSNHDIRGWLPQGWIDNSSWAALSATYTKLSDPPDAKVSAVRIKLESLDNGQLQLTSWQGEYDYFKGKKYAVTGWVRSPNSSVIKIGAREHNEPYAFYAQEDLIPTAEWERFEFVFEPEMDCDAWIMFVMTKPGTVDLAGVVVTEKE